MENITGLQLKKARLIEDMTQDEAAKMLGIHRSYLSLIENGKATPSPKLQKEINTKFENSVNKFIFL